MPGAEPLRQKRAKKYKQRAAKLDVPMFIHPIISIIKNRSMKNTRAMRITLLGYTLISYQFYVNLVLSFYLGEEKLADFFLNFGGIGSESLTTWILALFLCGVSNYLYAGLVRTIIAFQDHIEKKRNATKKVGRKSL
jgi:hypothetical protein